MDLLEHERLVAALLGGSSSQSISSTARSTVAVGGHELDAVGRDATISSFSMSCTLARVREEGGDGGGEELLALAAADDQRALLAGADEQLGLVGGIATNA